MNYKDYINARDLSWRILIQENITELPVDIVGVCHQLGIRTKYYKPEKQTDGKSLIIDGEPVIFVKSECPRQRIRFTIAHELGHILLGHVGKYSLVNREPSPNDNPIEREANVFASRLLAPACVLYGCGIKTADEISALCDISPQAAEYRMKRLAELYRRNMFMTSPLERQVYEQFSHFIKVYLHQADH